MGPGRALRRVDSRSWNIYTISGAVTIPSSHQTVSNDSSKEQRVEIVEVLLVPGGGPLLLLLLQTIMTLLWCPHYTALITPWSADGKLEAELDWTLDL